MSLVALDVGGAHVKAAGPERCRTVRFALWKDPGGLAPVVAELLSRLGPCTALAVTLTGELCDAYATRSEGVRSILDAVEDAARRAAPGAVAAMRVFTLDGALVPFRAARERPSRAAAANWLALAHVAADRLGPGDALLIDIGSTTTDIVALRDGRPLPKGRTDPERLASGELVYTGIERTPVCAVTTGVPWRGHRTRVAAELFATTRDVWTVMGALPEDPSDRDTADGREATVPRSRDRLARCVAADPATAHPGDTDALAKAVAKAQCTAVGEAIEQVIAGHGLRPQRMLACGSGEFLVRRVLGRRSASPEIVTLSGLAGPDASAAACAWALREIAGG